jgi:hypothetical protein
MKSRLFNPKVQQLQASEMPGPKNLNECKAFESQGATVIKIGHAKTKKPKRKQHFWIPCHNSYIVSSLPSWGDADMCGKAEQPSR